MTDADVDGAHIASLLMTYFFLQMTDLIRQGHLFLAQPPLYRITQSNKTYYAQDDAAKGKLLKQLQKQRGLIDIGRFKGLGEMTASQLKETTMDPKKRILLRVDLMDAEEAAARHVEQLMGKKPELRFQFIQEQALAKGSWLQDELDV
jgi:topoisomerase-4 subunit B